LDAELLSEDSLRFFRPQAANPVGGGRVGQKPRLERFLLCRR
jgi:hypothetical protein